MTKTKIMESNEDVKEPQVEESAEASVLVGAVQNDSYIKIELTLTSGQPLPIEQKVSRAIITQTRQIEKNIFEAEEALKINGVKVKDEDDPTGKAVKFVECNLPQVISDYDFRACMVALQSQLYDQSYLCGTVKDMTGAGITESFNKNSKGEFYNAGHIYVSLNDLCRVGYGVPAGVKVSTSQKDSMRYTLKALDQNQIKIEFGNGDIQEAYIAKIMGRFKRQSDGSEMYHLVLNPLFSTSEKGYGLMLRDTTVRLTEYVKSKGGGKAGKSAEMLAFMQLLAIQDRSKSWVISAVNLVDRIGLTKQFKKDKKRAIAKLQTIFEAFYELGFLLKIPTPTIPIDGIYRFKLNPDPKEKLGLSDEAEIEENLE